MEHNYFSLKDDDQGLSVILLEHPEAKILYERRGRFPDYLNINGTNPILHVQVEAIIENQLHDPKLPGVRAAFEKLQHEKGFTSHAARASIAQVFMVDFWAMLHERKPFDTEAYMRRLTLIGQAYGKLGRNDRCPCGSGNKFKRCCAPYAETFETSPLAGRLDLGLGSYMLEVPQKISDPLDPIFQLEARSHISEYMERLHDLDGALAVLKENIETAKSYENGSFLKNAWQDMLLLCENHPSLVEEGIIAFDQLFSLAEDNQEKSMLLCDKADLIISAGNLEAGKAEYAALFLSFPDFHFGRYRYALTLSLQGQKNEAGRVLKDLLVNDSIDEETRIEAADLLEELEN